MRALFDHPEVASWLERMAGLARVVLFDKRGTGLSDRVRALPTLQQRADDLRAVLDAAGSRAAILVGVSEGGPLSILCAASFPERVRGLLLVGSFARWAAALDYPQGWSASAFDALRRYITADWGRGDTLRAIVESRQDDPEVAAWAARAEQEGASPGAALDLFEMNLEADVRALLPAVAVPTVVLHSRRDAVIDVDNGRHLAARIPGARLIEVDARDHVPFFEGVEALHQALRWLLEQPAPSPSRLLATVLALEPGDAVDRAALCAIASLHAGVPSGPGLVWRFDGPQRAIRCAHALVEASAGRARAGVHAGEVVREGGSLLGDGVDTARAVARAAAAGEVRVSRVVRDLVHGSACTFAERGDLRLPDGRRLATLASRPPAAVGKG
jgi:pimeloyl-ACP methyl ester carboxylesterase